MSSDWSRVAAFVAAVDANLGAWLTEHHGVGLTEFRAVTHLSQSPDKELRVNDLAHRVNLSQSSTTRLVSRLEARGLARRDVCSEDGRGVYAVITEEGEALLRAARAPFDERLAGLLANAAAHDPQGTHTGWRGRSPPSGGRSRPEGDEGGGGTTRWSNTCMHMQLYSP
ncbi:MarR family winged helix-turn-helix transcriptional regulator [Nocardiopsis sp. CNR-923]|uniref:MarR family winged helix-turn-helix transcriptional regulator n=1 Tax=Nocardiopsis sp. CNR-923 TaxID=1904965 RepID=UPI0021CC92E6|nr:MarR family transcriptional regulator [Nocardiopsis sp. CNR-923]